MIDWFALLTSAIWILGLSVLLAMLGFAYALSDGTSVRRVLSQASFRLTAASGIALFALGMDLAVDTWFERVGWFVVMLLALWEGKSAVSDRMHGGERR
jgi:hypothetical protein